MRVVVTGGAGFIGRILVRRLAGRGDDVVALVRDPAKAPYLQRDHVRLVTSDLASVPALITQMKGADAVIHAAGQYRIGIRASERDAMLDANVGATERVLDAAVAAGVQRVVYLSTVNVFGDTAGKEVDETYRRDERLGFLSWYDETKYGAHLAAEKRIAGGAPIVIVEPGQVYGPNDHSLASGQIEHAYTGRLRYVTFPRVGMAWVHVDDLVDGMVVALDRGRIGESYIMAGAPLRIGESVTIAARVGGRKPPRLTMPVALMRMMAPLNDRFGGLPGMPGNLSETINAGGKVTYWARSDKAQTELGFKARSLQQGVADTWRPLGANPDAPSKD